MVLRRPGVSLHAVPADTHPRARRARPSADVSPGPRRRHRRRGAGHRPRRGPAARVRVQVDRAEPVLRRRRAQHEPVVAQLLLRRVRARRDGVDRQGARRPVVPGRERQAARGSRRPRCGCPRHSRGRRPCRCSTRWCARLFGRTAGLVAAAALAVMPVAVITARSDTMDSLMMALLVAGGAAGSFAPRRPGRRAALAAGGGARAGVQRQAVRALSCRFRRSRCCTSSSPTARCGRAPCGCWRAGRHSWPSPSRGLRSPGSPRWRHRPFADRVVQRRRLERRLRVQRARPARQGACRRRRDGPDRAAAAVRPHVRLADRDRAGRRARARRARVARRAPVAHGEPPAPCRGDRARRMVGARRPLLQRDEHAAPALPRGDDASRRGRHRHRGGCAGAAIGGRPRSGRRRRRRHRQRVRLGAGRRGRGSDRRHRRLRPRAAAPRARRRDGRRARAAGRQRGEPRPERPGRLRAPGIRGAGTDRPAEPLPAAADPRPALRARGARPPPPPAR